ncbi:MAG TPA: zf-HC2 domain-containing protein [Verrucomicrobiae bacterium]|nr:zf-HC2 domain-containing protein [Verrucomicrobiae bacterium]
MNCKKVVVELTSYLDGVLDSSTRTELELHLSRCTDCRLVVDTCRKTIQIFCNSEPVPLPEDVRSRLHSALLERFRRKAKST